MKPNNKHKYINKLHFLAIIPDHGCENICAFLVYFLHKSVSPFHARHGQVRPAGYIIAAFSSSLFSDTIEWIMELARKYLWRYRKVVMAGFLFVILTNVTKLIAPWILKYAVDDLRAGVVMEKLLLYAGMILGVAILQGIFLFFMRNIIIGVSRHIEYQLRMEIFDHLQKLPLEFYQMNRTGDIISRATSDLNNFRMFLGPGIMNLMNTIILFPIAIAFMSSISPRLTFYSLSPLPLATLVMAWASAILHRRYRQVQEANAKMSSQAQENFSGIRVVKAYVQEDSQTEVFRLKNTDYLKKNLRLVKFLGLFHPVIGFFLGLTTIIVLWAGGRMIIRGSISLGDLVAFLAFMSLLILPTVSLGWVVNLFQRGAASAARINWILNTEPTIREPDHPEPVVSLSGAVSFRGLTFTYPGMKEPTLKNVNLEIAAGQKVALVGRTGSGKTTLVSLVPKMYSVLDGCLHIDGIDINRVPLRLLRKSIGFVPQETFLFSETLERNIILGAIEEEVSIEAATSLAGMKPDIETFPSGYETMLGERGITLSGGQKQRTALARAIIRDPRILILDDAFSSVDAATEKTILGNLQHVMQGRTTIIITHRLSSITDADMIIVLKDGSVAETGRHDELMAAGGLYAEMFHRQSIIEELEKEDQPA